MADAITRPALGESVRRAGEQTKGIASVMNAITYMDRAVAAPAVVEAALSY